METTKANWVRVVATQAEEATYISCPYHRLRVNTNIILHNDTSLIEDRVEGQIDISEPIIFPPMKATVRSREKASE